MPHGAFQSRRDNDQQSQRYRVEREASSEILDSFTTQFTDLGEPVFATVGNIFDLGRTLARSVLSHTIPTQQALIAVFPVYVGGLKCCAGSRHFSV